MVNQLFIECSLQSWSLIFIEEVTMLTDDDQLIGVCERDVDIMRWETPWKTLKT